MKKTKRLRETIIEKVGHEGRGPQEGKSSEPDSEAQT